MAHPTRRDAAAGSAVAADDGGGRDAVAGRRAGDPRAAGRAALGGAARSGRLRPAAPLRRRAVVGRAFARFRRVWWPDGGTPTTSRTSPKGGLPRTRVHDRVEAPVPGAALRSTFVYRHRQLADDLAAHRDAAEAGVGPLVVAVTGSTGLVGSALVALLSTGGHRVIRLVRRAPRDASERRWDPEYPEPGLLNGVDAVVHLAGESIAGRFTDAHRAAVRDSRIDPTRRLAELAGRTEGVRVFVGASAVGYYGFDRGDAMLREESVRGDGFLADVVADWEAATVAAAEAGLRVALVRTGIVQAARGGTLRLMRPLFSAGLGGRLGRRQTMAVLDRSRRPDRRVLPRHLGRAAHRSGQCRVHPTRCATSTTRRRWRTCCVAPRCYRFRRWVRDSCWGSRAPANWRRQINASRRPNCRPSGTVSGSRSSRTRSGISWGVADEPPGR